MTAATLTLTDFLLQRIAEDEDGARGELSMSAQSALGVQWLDLMRRVLAECEAKRRIVEVASQHGTGQSFEVLTALAGVYADHPDYREEWRP